MTPSSQTALWVLIFSGLGSLPIWAQDPQASEDPHAGHTMTTARATSTKHDHGGVEEAPIEMGSMDMGSMQGGSAPPDARDPHAYAGCQDFGPYHPLHLADTHNFASLLADNFEITRSDDNTAAAYDLQGWFGRTYNRAVFKAEGDIDGGEIQDARSELLWGHAIAPYWDTQFGVRYDSGDGPNRSWLAFGIQGLAPYWFDVEVTGYLGEDSRTALRVDASYELLFTQKLVLQPSIEADVYGKNDRARGLGSGLADLTAALRLRYEIRREFAPYVGVEWAGKFGKTRDLARAAGEDANDVRVVAGVRFWF